MSNASRPRANGDDRNHWGWIRKQTEEMRMNDRYELYSVAYAKSCWMKPYKPVKVAMRVSDLDGVLLSIAAQDIKDWFVHDKKLDKYVDPEIVKKLTGITWVEGVGYPECPCCTWVGAMADHTMLPNCRCYKG